MVYISEYPSPMASAIEASSFVAFLLVLGEQTAVVFGEHGSDSDWWCEEGASVELVADPALRSEHVRKIG